MHRTSVKEHFDIPPYPSPSRKRDDISLEGELDEEEQEVLDDLEESEEQEEQEDMQEVVSHQEVIRPVHPDMALRRSPVAPSSQTLLLVKRDWGSQRMIIITINLLIGNQTRIRPHNKDHIQILKQAGLSLGEVTGIVAKPGYLEVSLKPGAVSGAGAQRETQKQVNDKITITSIRERGSNRVVQLGYEDVPFEVMDETLIQYTELFANVEGAGRRMRWEMIREEDDLSPGGELVGKWSGERSVLVTLKKDVGHIPTWHFVGGGKLRIRVPGKKNCPRCLKSVGECKGEGEWTKCETSKTLKGDWKEVQEKFLDGLGWTDKKQKVMEELERKEAEGLEVEEQDEAEIRAAEEQLEKEADEKEGLVQILDEGKQCGGIMLRNFP